MGQEVARTVSVIIPTLDEAREIGRTVAAARRGYLRPEVEVVVADGGSRDGTAELAPDDVAVVHAPRGRAVQMNRGAAAAHGQILVFCHADTRLPAGWREAVVRALGQPGVSGGAFSIRFCPPRGILYVLNWPRYPANWRIMYGDQVQFMRRATFERVGGFPEMPLMEDIAMARALRREGRLVRLPLRVETSSRRFLERGPLRQMLLNAWCVLGYLYLGKSAEEIARRYRSSREEV